MIVTNVGRDAVDAEFAKDERNRSRTAKSCGPDAPVAGVKLLGSKLLRGDGGKKADHRGEREVSRKTIAQGRPECFR